MYWKKLLWTTTLSCRVGSTRLRPECPLKSSELSNYSWSISTVLESSFSLPLAAKHAFHRPSDQWIDCGNWLWRFSFSRNELVHLLLDAFVVNDEEENVTFFENLIIGERKFPWFHVKPIPSSNGDYSWWRASRFSSLWFCFGFWSARKIFHLQL